MSLCKSVSDSKLDNKKRNSTDRLRGGGDNNETVTKKEKQTCAIHTRSNLTWNECFPNPRSVNYGQDMRRINNNGPEIDKARIRC